MKHNWSHLEAEAATGGKSTASFTANNIVIDSRKISPGDLFIALNGEHTDGHNFVSDALKAGAAACVVSKLLDKFPSNATLLVVKDTKKALTDLAIYRRNQINAKIIAVTGSAGKTSTKEQLQIAFSAIGKTHYSKGNFNNDLGAPISMANMPKDTEYAIFELGMNHPGEISYLTNMVKPDIAIITNVAPAHLQFFTSVEQIADAKAEIYQGVSEDGFAIVNSDCDYGDYVAAIAGRHGIKNIITYGQKPGANYLLMSYLEDESGSSIVASIDGTKKEYNLSSYGIHYAINSLAVLAAAKSAAIDVGKAAKALANFSSLKGRGQQHKITLDGKDILLIDDSYNANPASIKAALKVLGSCSKMPGRKLAILSDMRELGTDSAKLHQDLAGDIFDNNIDKVIAIGENMQYLYDAIPKEKRLNFYNNVNELIPEVKIYISNNDMVLVKGSLGTEIYKLVDSLIKDAI
jgi:UDP-N-acetylmuramoyl-tripeptide--D-alanyl-D-alanine ligase